MPAKPPCRTPSDLYWEFDERPSMTRLRRRSADVVSVFLAGYSHQEIAHALRVDVALVEDAIRWELKRRGARGSL